MHIYLFVTFLMIVYLYIAGAYFICLHNPQIKYIIKQNSRLAFLIYERKSLLHYDISLSWSSIMNIHGQVSQMSYRNVDLILSTNQDQYQLYFFLTSQVKLFVLYV